VRKLVGSDAADLSEHLTEAQQILRQTRPSGSSWSSAAGVCAGEQIARRGCGRFSGASGTAGRGVFDPETYGQLLDMFEKAFKRQAHSSPWPCTTAAWLRPEECGRRGRDSSESARSRRTGKAVVV